VPVGRGERGQRQRRQPGRGPEIETEAGAFRHHGADRAKDQQLPQAAPQQQVVHFVVHGSAPSGSGANLPPPDLSP
jgi:hypothetical protein